MLFIANRSQQLVRTFLMIFLTNLNNLNPVFACHVKILNDMFRHYDTLATGIIYFHRFYMFHSFKQFPRYVSSTDT